MKSFRNKIKNVNQRVKRVKFKVIVVTKEIISYFREVSNQVPLNVPSDIPPVPFCSNIDPFLKKPKSNLLIVMKTVFAWSVLLFISVQLLYTQDTITLRNRNIIESKVIEISNENIRYVKYNNLEGPVYVLPVNEIRTITFQNGEIINYSTETIASLDSLYNGGVFSTQKRKLFLDGKDYAWENYARLTKEYDQIAYNMYLRGKHLRTTGAVLRGIGIPLLAFGVATVVAYGIADETDDSFILPISIGLGVGGSLYIASIPLMKSGNRRLAESVDFFNKKQTQNNNLTLNIGTTQNGFGLVISF